MTLAPYTSPTLAERFWAKVDKREPSECWLWTGSLAAGYGRIAAGRGYGGRPLGAHRVALFLDGRPPREDEHVHHVCGTRACVNPAHLETVRDQAEHSARHLSGCGRHGDADIRVVHNGRNVGMRYCALCNREKAARRRRRDVEIVELRARIAALEALLDDKEGGVDVSPDRSAA